MIKNSEEAREAKQKRKGLMDQLKASNKPEFTADEQRAWDDLKKEYDQVNADIEAWESSEGRRQVLSEMEARQAEGLANTGKASKELAQARSHEGIRVFANLGEQLRSVYESAVHHTPDERLTQLNNEARAQGNNESIGSEGGFAVQTDFAGQMFDTAVTAGDILSRVDTYEVGANANAAQWNAIDESDISDTVYGGVQVYWAGEAKAVSDSKPTFRDYKIDLQKLMGIAYATEELMQDTNFMSQLYTRAFTLGIQRKLEGDIADGDGVKKPLGILRSGALVAVAKENAQSADTFNLENATHMWHRLHASSRRNAVWLMNPDVEEQLPFMKLTVGTGGVPVYLPPTGISEAGYSTLFGRPVIPTDQCKALGDQGDVLLSDLSYYMLIRKGGIQSAQSIHVQFLTAENCFRFTFRANGAPKVDKPLTIKNSTNQRSPFVTLAAR